jgi:type IV secretion system protein VirB8
MSENVKTILEAKNWYKDRYQYLLVQRKLLTLITLFSLLCTLGTVVAIALLAPLKTVDPFVIQVDQKSGITQTVDPLSVKELTANEAVNDFFIVQYIRSRETYSVTDLARNYNIVRVMSDANKVYPDFVRTADPNNPRSNAARMGSSGIRTVKFKSITYLSPQLVQARLLIEERKDTNVVQFHKIALVAFQYIKLSLTNEERYINPLGFRVTDYRLDEDILQR